MSYILDALRRADAERARGAVPGLHARPLAESVTTERGSVKPLLGWMFGVAVLTTVVGLGLWRWQAVPPVRETPVAVTAAPAQPITPTPVAPPTPRQASQPEVSRMPRANTSPPPAPVALSAASAPDTPASSGEARERVVPWLSELPEDLRRRVPALTITGSVYASDPRQRLLLVNNLVLPQGSQVAAGMTLQEIHPGSAVFSFQETRFRLRY